MAPPQARTLAIEMPADLYTWLVEAAETSHRTPEQLAVDALRYERDRWEANWQPRSPSA